MSTENPPQHTQPHENVGRVLGVLLESFGTSRPRSCVRALGLQRPDLVEVLFEAAELVKVLAACEWILATAATVQLVQL